MTTSELLTRLAFKFHCRMDRNLLKQQMLHWPYLDKMQAQWRTGTSSSSRCRRWSPPARQRPHHLRRECSRCPSADPPPRRRRRRTWNEQHIEPDKPHWMTLSSAELRPGSRHWAYTSHSPSDNLEDRLIGFQVNFLNLERRIEALVSKAPIFYQGLWCNT